jgi:hypothetical protein
MSETPAQFSLLDDLLDPFIALLNIEQAKLIVAAKATAAVQARADELAEKSNQGTLTTSEHDEYARFLVGCDCFALLQLKASALIKARS